MRHDGQLRGHYAKAFCFMITLINVILRRSAKVLLDRVHATINPGEQVCTDCWLIHPKGTCDR